MGLGGGVEGAGSDRAGPSQRATASTGVDKPLKEGQSMVRTGTPAPAARPKAKAAAVSSGPNRRVESAREVQAPETKKVATGVAGCLLGSTGKGGGVDGGAGGAVDWPDTPDPYRPPPLPRPLCASRVVELEKRLGELQEVPGDPRIEVVQKSLESARAMLREAGGPSERRLCFSVLDAEETIRRAEERLAASKEKLRRDDESARDALTQQARSEAEVRACEQALENARAKHAHLGFQVGVEACQNAKGYDELVGALSLVEAHVVSGGNDSLREAQGLVSRFVRKFRMGTYDKSQDPMLLEVASVASQSSNDTIIIDRWQDQVADAERQAIVAEGIKGDIAHGPVGAEGVKQAVVQRFVEGEGTTGGEDDALDKVRAAAASACVHLQICKVEKARRGTEAASSASAASGTLAVREGNAGHPQVVPVLARGTNDGGPSLADEDMLGARKRCRSLMANISRGEVLVNPLWAGAIARENTLALCKWSPPAARYAGRSTDLGMREQTHSRRGRSRSKLPAIGDIPNRTGKGSRPP